MSSALSAHQRFMASRRNLYQSQGERQVSVSGSRFGGKCQPPFGRRGADVASPSLWTFCWQRSRDAQAAKRFFHKTLQATHTQEPRVINVDKNAAYPKAIDEMKAESDLPLSVELRQNKYLNNLIEQDHRFIKRLTKPGMGFHSFNTADANVKGIWGDEHALVLDKLWESKKEMLRLAQNSCLKFSEWWLNESWLIGKLCP